MAASCIDTNHPDIEPAVEIGEDEEIALETRDVLDGQITPASTVADFASLDAGAVHPLTGPVFVKGAQPGDMLEIEAENLTLACRNAVLNMMELLQERGFTRKQAYVICSVAVDLRISKLVSALLPEAIFDGD